MPKYKLPPLPKPEKGEDKPSNVGIAASSKSPDQWQRTISIPVNDKILEALKVGDKVTATLEGEVHGTENTESKSEDYEHINKSIRVMVAEVEVYAKDEDGSEERAGMRTGYSEG